MKPPAPLTKPAAPAHNASVAQSTPAIPPFEPPPMPLSVADSSRRILWIIALYRAICAAVLLGIALLVDLNSIQITTPSVFIAGTALYFVFALIGGCSPTA
jgi:hypothetical protein